MRLGIYFFLALSFAWSCKSNQSSAYSELEDFDVRTESGSGTSFVVVPSAPRLIDLNHLDSFHAWITSAGACTNSNNTPQALFGCTKVTSNPDAPFLIPPTIFTPYSILIGLKITQ